MYLKSRAFVNIYDILIDLDSQCAFNQLFYCPKHHHLIQNVHGVTVYNLSLTSQTVNRYMKHLINE